MAHKRVSPKACQDLLDVIAKDGNTEDFEGATDCAEGCVVEVDGWCPHGWMSAANTLLTEGV
jgi:hypothetical protein